MARLQTIIAAIPAGSVPSSMTFWWFFFLPWLKCRQLKGHEDGNKGGQLIRGKAPRANGM